MFQIETVRVSAEARGRRVRRKSRHGRDTGEVESAPLVAWVGWERAEGSSRMTPRHMEPGQLANSGIERWWGPGRGAVLLFQ